MAASPHDRIVLGPMLEAWGEQHVQQTEMKSRMGTDEIDVVARGPGAAELTSHHLPFGFLKELERPGDFVRDLGPNWYASIMGTGIVAIAGADLPFRVPGLHTFATVVWLLAAAALLALTTAFAARWIRFPDRARADASNPVMAQFWGAPAMALMTVGTGTLILGRSLIGRPRRWTPTGRCGDPGPP